MELFKADKAAAEETKRGLQQALDLIDEAKTEAIETPVIVALDKAHRKVCEGITFLNAGESDLGAGVRPIDARSKREPKLMAGAPEPYRRAGFGRKCRKLCE